MRRVWNSLSEIAGNLLISGLLVLACSGVAAAGTASLEWAPANTSAYSAGGIVSCGASKKVDFKVGYSGSNCGGTIGSNPYRFEFFLYRNGVQIGYIPYQQASSCWYNSIFYSVDADAGTYSAIVNFQKRNLSGWVPVSKDYSGNLNASKTPATPAFLINGQLATTSAPANVTVNIKDPITIDATQTTCETTYNVGAQESDKYWNRTLKYEWWKWFPGDAPNNINLQQLATTYSNPPDYLGTDLTRYGTPLFGGDLSPGVQRYYRVNLCTAEPTWVCATALLRVNP
ncbi:MAG TPA: hypothetical protein VGX48_17415 [Pyrinomonadaceae bacterium]|jgi:hypothetical protein|nr:hypothetical protein [Pyrinomonadaceae bacterium]